MRVYFLSSVPAVLKLNGMFIGTIDGFERHIELDKNDAIFAEIVPGENLQPINFFLDGKFFKSPPAFCDLYEMEGDYLIYMREYAPKNGTIEVLYQTRFHGNLITLFAQGGLYLSVDGAHYLLEPLPPSFRQFTVQEHTLAGKEVLSITNGSHLILIGESGAVIFKSGANRFECADTLKITASFETCTCAILECEYSYNGESLSLISAKTEELRPPERDILHFAFFEAVLTCADCKKYLDDSIADRAPHLKSYLGKFVAVTVPPEKFYLVHGNINAAGLVYPKSKNLYEVKYFAVDIEGDKITNVYPI